MRKNLLNRTANFIKKYINNVKLIIEFIKLTDHKQYKEWQLKDDKKLYIVFIEWLFNDIGHYVFIGFMVTLALTVNGWFGLLLKSIMGYWLLSRLLYVVRNGE